MHGARIIACSGRNRESFVARNCGGERRGEGSGEWRLGRISALDCVYVGRIYGRGEELSGDN